MEEARPPSHLEMDRDVARYFVKHAQRACRRLDALGRGIATSADEQALRDLASAKSTLLKGVVLPLTERFPDLRGQDLTEIVIESVEGNPSRADQADAAAKRTFGIFVKPGQLEKATASTLLAMTSKADAELKAVITKLVNIKDLLDPKWSSR